MDNIEVIKSYYYGSSEMKYYEIVGRCELAT